ncbi:urate hydroxylase PuuD [Vibrio sp. SM6]|uniref:Urate hydroxylase PuuD n=1 Tax=Vibrio agarilyticus TaxID=2726741 RepID=A0A7X8YHZ6_9VIBR|nr:urate hydroxylase PuuD [Vibrio agarilyticus]NLS14633.1 urate hydroxylase PuuD [Vibrio agarilyticus]
MWPQLYEWIALFIKWFHVICGVAWIGASFYFTWLDNSLETPPKWKKDRGIKGDLWAVHGGGFYEVAKYQVGPKTMPQNLHWFKWEAYTTWLTGTALLIWMYYFNAQAYLIDPRILVLTSAEAITLGIAGVISGVLCYEWLLRSPLANSRTLFVVSLVTLGGLFFYGFSHVFSGRGAFIHMGVLLGSIMVNNVFYKIIPGQRKMVAQVAAGEPVDPAPGLEGKKRSIHNNYLTLPVIFLMISNHYPMIYQHQYNWLVALIIMLISAGARHYFNLKHSGQHRPMVLISSAAAMGVLAVVVSWPMTRSAPTPAIVSSSASKAAPPASEATTQTKAQITPSQESLELVNMANTDSIEQQVMTIVKTRCSTCHSVTPSDDVFTMAPAGATFDNWQDIERWSGRIIARTVDSADMPFLNKTEMTLEERDTLKRLLYPSDLKMLDSEPAH